MRRVLNGVAKFHDHSLNPATLTGSDLRQSLILILHRSRQIQNAISAVTGTLVQVRILPTDQPLFRFSWREDPATNFAVFQYTRHFFRAKDSPTCANCALESIASGNEAKFLDASGSFQKIFFMEDYQEPSESTEKAKQKAQNIVRMLRLGDSNLIVLLSKVPELYPT